MAETTTYGDQIDRELAADQLNDIARALREGDDARVTVGNKTIRLDPPETINYQIDVVERSTLLRGNRESITIELEWKPR